MFKLCLSPKYQAFVWLPPEGLCALDLARANLKNPGVSVLYGDALRQLTIEVPECIARDRRARALFANQNTVFVTIERHRTEACYKPVDDDGALQTPDTYAILLAWLEAGAPDVWRRQDENET